MKITIEDRAQVLRSRLHERLERAALLRCDEHGESVAAVTIHGRENGWFDSTFITCCESLQLQAAAVVKERC